MNACLQPQHPHVGTGIQSHRSTVHPDQPELQQVVASAGLIALNTWGRRGPPVGTFLQHDGHSVQIDFLFARLPSTRLSMRARALPNCELVHPTGMRRIPVTCALPWPQRPSAPSDTTDRALFRQARIREALDKQPDLAERFQQQVQHHLSADPTLSIDQCLKDSWRAAVHTGHRPPSVSGPNTSQDICLKSFWAPKRELRQSATQASSYLAPLVWHVVEAAPAVLIRAQPRLISKLRPLLLLWKHVSRFRQQDKALRQRVKLKQQAKVDTLIQSALEAEQQGISTLHQVTNQLRLRNRKRSIHFQGCT